MTMGPQANGQLYGSDYTQLGINSQAVYFSANMYGDQGGFYAELFEANKSQMEKGLANFTADGSSSLRIPPGPGITAATGPFLADPVQPTINLDRSNRNVETFLDTLDGPDPVTGHFCGFFGGGFSDSCSGLARWDMRNAIAHDTGGPAPTLPGSYVPAAPFLASGPARQPSRNRCLDELELRLSRAPWLRPRIT